MADPWKAEAPATDVDAVAAQLIRGAFASNQDWIKEALVDGADVNAVDPKTGLAALHIVVGQNDLRLCRFLVEECGARFFPDMFGRMPTIVAAECRVDDELTDYIGEKEAAYEAEVAAIQQTMPKIPPRDG